MSKPTLPNRVAQRPHPMIMPKRATAQMPLSARQGFKGRAVGAMVPKITRKVFEKFGFSTATLLTDWSVIVGADIARYTLPERLKWPRGYEGAAGESEAGRPGATLMLRVEPARALDVQYKARLLTDRINAYFGYRAVADIRIIQAPVARPDTAQTAIQRPPQPPHAPCPAVQAVADDMLRAALAELEASIRADTAALRR